MDAYSARRWLTEEAREHLREFGPYGLYEFLWTLNGSQFALPPDEARRICRGVALTLLGEVADLYRVRWPTHTIVGDPLPLSALDDDDSWRVGDDFVALVPKDLAPSGSAQTAPP